MHGVLLTLVETTRVRAGMAAGVPIEQAERLSVN